MQVTKHESYDEKCDVFAMGCLMYDLHVRQLRHVSLFQNAGLCTVDAHVLGQYAVKVGFVHHHGSVNTAEELTHALHTWLLMDSQLCPALDLAMLGLVEMIMAEAVKREFLFVTSSHCTQEEVVRLTSTPKRRSKAGDTVIPCLQVAGGYRPAIPADMPEAVRALVEACWAQEACARPSACEVKKALEVRDA